MREVVAYAAERFVTIVPEIEMPGHSQAAVAAYPYLGNFGDTIKPWTMWGVTNYILNPSDTTIAFMQDVLTEVMGLFPGPFIHIGGDEAPKLQWQSSPRAQRLIDALAIRDPAIRRRRSRARIDCRAGSRRRWTRSSRRMVAGSSGGTRSSRAASRRTQSSCRGGALQAASPPREPATTSIMTPGSTPTSITIRRRRDSEPLAIGGFLPIDSVYLYEPVPAELEPQFAKHILGAQGAGLDRVHRRSEERGVHGLSARGGARRGAVDAVENGVTWPILSSEVGTRTNGGSRRST